MIQPMSLEERSYRSTMAASSARLLSAIRAVPVFECGHRQTPENTHRIADTAMCRTCRRGRWNRGFRQSIAKRERTALARHKLSEMREAFIASAIGGGEGALSVDDLLQAIASAFSVSLDEMLSPSRKPYLVEARAVAARILRERDLSFPTIGKLIGRPEHSTIIYLLRNFETYIRRNPLVVETYNALRDKT